MREEREKRKKAAYLSHFPRTQYRALDNLTAAININRGSRCVGEGSHVEYVELRYSTLAALSTIIRSPVPHKGKVIVTPRSSPLT